MALQVDINVTDLGIQGSQQVIIKCTADSGSEEQELVSAVVDTTASPQGRGRGTWPRFTFAFSEPCSQIVLWFSAHEDSTGAELGTCSVLVPLQTPANPWESRLINGAAPSRCRTAILGLPVASTDIVKFTGKLRFSIQRTCTSDHQHSGSVVPVLSPVAGTERGRGQQQQQQQQRKSRGGGRWRSRRHSSAHVDELVAREAAALADRVAVPGESAVVTVIFHALNLRWEEEEGVRDIASVACPGEISGHEGIRRVHRGTVVSGMRSILAQKMVRCPDGTEAVQIHLTNPKLSDHAIYRTSVPLASLRPFVCRHWRQPLESAGESNDGREGGEGEIAGGDDPASFAALAGGGGRHPGMLCTAILTPPRGSYPEHEGLELLVLSVDPGFSTDYSRMVVCAQIAEAEDEPRLGGPASHLDLLPLEGGRRTMGEVSTGGNGRGTLAYKMAVMNIAPRCDEVYFFFPADREVHDGWGGGSALLRLFLHPVRARTDAPWWEEPHVGNVTLDIAPILGFLMKAECQGGVWWEGCMEGQGSRSQPPGDPNGTCSSPSNQGTIRAVLRWKAKCMPFMSPPAAALELETLPDLNRLLHEPAPPAAEEVASRDSAPHRRPPVDNEEKVEEARDLLLVQHRKAVLQMGKDVLQLRQLNASLVAENEQLRARTTTMMMMTTTGAGRPSGEGSSSVNKPFDYAQLETQGKHELAQTVLLLLSQLEAERAAREESEGRARGLRDLLLRQRDCEAQYAQLLEVHAAQQGLVLGLQSKARRLQRCYEVCTQQQEIIGQLEVLLAHHVTAARGVAFAHDGGREGGAAATVGLSRRENSAEVETNHRRYRDEDSSQQRRLEGVQRKWQSRVEAGPSQVVARSKQLEEPLEKAELSRTADQGESYAALQQRLLLTETKVSALLTEMKDMTRKWGIEKSQYEAKLEGYHVPELIAADAEPTCANSNGKFICF